MHIADMPKTKKDCRHNIKSLQSSLNTTKASLFKKNNLCNCKQDKKLTCLLLLF